MTCLRPGGWSGGRGAEAEAPLPPLDAIFLCWLLSLLFFWLWRRLGVERTRVPAGVFDCFLRLFEDEMRLAKSGRKRKKEKALFRAPRRTALVRVCVSSVQVSKKSFPQEGMSPPDR